MTPVKRQLTCCTRLFFRNIVFSEQHYRITAVTSRRNIKDAKQNVKYICYCCVDNTADHLKITISFPTPVSLMNVMLLCSDIWLMTNELLVWLKWKFFLTCRVIFISTFVFIVQRLKYKHIYFNKILSLCILAMDNARVIRINWNLAGERR